MTNANEVCAAVKNALDADRPVFLTDGTVTQKIVQVEVSNWGFKRDTLDVLVIDGYENKAWIQIHIKWPWDVLDGWALGEIDGSLFIAPEWWFEI